ncbi:MAG TPA: TIM barrel protein [Acidimicrobiales bacterium]|nr:TIM barrel protein [Acidimicrobiales bacterium]
MTEWILWAAGFDCPLRERAAAARAAGCDHVSLTRADLETSPADAARTVRDEGVQGTVLDGIVKWLPGRDRPGAADQMEENEPIFAAAEAAGVRSINVLAMRPSELPVSEIARHFGALCDRAARSGLRLHIEFAPGAGVPDLATAWAMVQAADRPNGGILFDTWHFTRSGSTLDTLAQIPGDRIFAVQVSDAAPEATGTIFDETLHRRRLPGAGTIDFAVLADVLHRIGALDLVGPEVLSDDLRVMTPVDAATVAVERSRAALRL